MKKVISIILSVLMAMLMIVPAIAVEKTVEPVASAYASYDKAKVAAGEFSDLTYDQIASLIFDFIDSKIAEVTADFDNFEVEVYGQTVEIPVAITGIDSLLQYKDHLTELGGDFANLDASALNKTRADGDINLMYSFFEFMAANSDILGKVFGWTEENVFDYGKVGEYIESLDESDETNKAIKDFYHDYLLGNDIQSKFVAEIAREMGYTIGESEDFDTVINNGILGKVVSVCEKFLSEDAINAIKNFNLKTTDIYALVKEFCTLVQNDKWDDITMYYTYILDNLVRPVLKVTFGYTPTTGKSVDTPAEFTTVYKDLEKLEALSGGKVQYQANDGSYYEVTVKDGAVTGAKEVTYGESFINLDPPVVEIGDKNTVIGTYTPSNPDVTSYNPTVYTDASYAEYLDNEMVAAAGEFGIQVKAEALPEAIAAIIAAGNGTAMVDEFKMSVSAPIEMDLEVTFEELEALANETIAESLPAIQTNMVDPAVATAIGAANKFRETFPVLPVFTGSATINSVTVELNYTGYASEDKFICEVSVAPTYDITWDGNIWDYAQYAGITKEKIQADYIEPAVKEAIKNPVATIVVENLNGSIEGLDDLFALMDFVDTDFDVDYGVLDFAANYDAYKGVIGQMNRVLCDALKMLLSDEGFNSLELTEGGNSNLTDNIQKLCDKADSLISLAKKFMDEAQFSEFTSGLSDLFVSSHGFNANMIYEMDFSNVENLYVCALRLGCDMFVEDNSGVLYDIHEIIEDLDTLDSMLVGVTEYALANVINKANEELDGFEYKFTPKTAEQLKALDTVKMADPAKDVIMTDLVDLAFYAAEYAVPMVNDIINSLVDSINGETGFIPYVAFELGVKKGENWEETLNALTDRALDLLGGLLICADEASSKSYVLDKLSVVLSAVLPMNSMLSNYTGLSQAVGYIFTDACDGDFEGFLSYFEVKDDAVAGDVSVTKALINASDYIVDAFFPNTVETELYAQSETVQETFTGEVSDIGIASRNMKAVNARKANLLACVFDLLKESKTLIPYLAGAKICKVHSFGEWTEATKATCTTDGSEERVCSACLTKETRTVKAKGHSFGEWKTVKAPKCTEKGTEERVCSACPEKETRDIAAKGHSYGEWTIKTQPTCVNEGVKVSVCSECSSEKTEKIPATGNHIDNNGDESCDVCGKDLSKPQTFFEKVAAFFQRIFDWFKNLFSF